MLSHPVHGKHIANASRSPGCAPHDSSHCGGLTAWGGSRQAERSIERAYRERNHGCNHCNAFASGPWQALQCFRIRYTASTLRTRARASRPTQPQLTPPPPSCDPMRGDPRCARSESTLPRADLSWGPPLSCIHEPSIMRVRGYTLSAEEGIPRFGAHSRVRVRSCCPARQSPPRVRSLRVVLV